jgi:hypothetical protein
MNGGEESVPSMAVGLGGVVVVGVVGAGMMMMMVVVPEMAHASEMVVSNVSNVVNVDDASWSALVASEPKNALSLPTWVIHVASVVEWWVFLLKFSPTGYDAIYPFCWMHLGLEFLEVEWIIIIIIIIVT